MSNAECPPALGAEALWALSAEGRQLVILDVRRSAAFEKNPVMLPGALRVLPESMSDWAAAADRAIPVLVYCVFGHEVSQGACDVLRRLGFDAKYLDGGLSEWQSRALPVV